MNSKLLFVILFVLGGFVIFGLLPSPNKQPAATTSSAQTLPVTTGLTPQTQTMGAVTVEVTPITLSPDTQVVFTVSFNTHSVELNYDFTDIITLTDDSGREYNALDWTGSSGGHHLTGDISFEPLSASAKSVMMTLSGIDDQIANLSWEI